MISKTNPHQIAQIKISERKLMEFDPVVENILINFDRQVCVAGGAVRDCVHFEIPADYDLFILNNPYTTSNNDPDDIISQICSALESEGFTNTFKCPNGLLYTFKNEDEQKIQLITTEYYSDVTPLLHSFDFSTCMWAYDGQTVYTCYQAIKDYWKKQLTLFNLPAPAATINRLHKYRNKGYYTGDAILSIADQLGSMDPEQYQNLSQQIYID